MNSDTVYGFLRRKGTPEKYKANIFFDFNWSKWRVSLKYYKQKGADNYANKHMILINGKCVLMYVLWLLLYSEQILLVFH